VLLDDPAQALHAPLPLFRLHFQREQDGLGGLIDVIRVHQQRIAEFAGGAGELAEDQHAPLIVTGSQKFLGDQVHAVVE
jgi:hypothetical protein